MSLSSTDMENKRSAYILCSLSSSSFSGDYFSRLFYFCEVNNIFLTVIMLDELEIINQTVINNLDIAKAKQKVQSLKRKISSSLDTNSKYLSSVAKWATYKSIPFIMKCSELCSELYNSNLSFRNNCRNQIFKNLHPILREKNISRKDNKNLDKLSKYLISEISLKFYLINSKGFNFEIAPKSEMELMQNIYNNKYPELTNLLSNKIEFIVFP